MGCCASKKYATIDRAKLAESLEVETNLRRIWYHFGITEEDVLHISEMDQLIITMLSVYAEVISLFLFFIFCFLYVFVC